MSRYAPYLAGAFALALNAAVILPLAARGTTSAKFGQLVTALTVVAIAAPVLSGGLHVFTVRFAGSHRPYERRQAGLIVRDGVIVLSVLAMVSIGLSAPALGVLAATAAAALATAACSLVMASARATREPAWFAIVTLTLQSGTLATAAAILAINGNLTLAVSAIGAIGCLFSLSYIGLRRPKESAVAEMWRASFPQLSRSSLANALKYSLPLLPHLTLLLFTIQGPRLAVAGALGFVSAAEFQFAAILGGLGITLVILVHGVWDGNSLGLPEQSFQRSLLQYSRMSSLVCTACLLAMGGAMGQILGVLMPSDLFGSGPVKAAIALLPAASMQLFADLNNSVALRVGATALVSAATCAGALTCLLVLLLGLRDLGIVWASVAIVAGIAMRGVTLVALLRRRGHQPVLSRVVLAGPAITVLVSAGLIRLSV